MSSGAAKVFISYRREETAGHAGRLYDVMSNRFGDSNVFMDVDIAPGVDFVSRITEAVGAAHVLLVIVGPRWSTIANGTSLPRIFEPGDFVRLEVETGLRRSDVTVIPVLVGGAKMPDPTALPAPLRALTRRNALELSDTRWRYDVDRLLGALDGLLAGTSAVHARPAPPPPRPAPAPARAPVAQVPFAPAPVRPAPVTPAAWTPPAAAPAQPPKQPWSFGGALLFLTTTLVAAGAGLAGGALGEKLKRAPDDSNGARTDVMTRILNEVGPAAVAWAVIGAAVAIWLATCLRTRRMSVGWLALGGLTGALAGAGGAAIVAIPRYRGLPDHFWPEDTRHMATIVGAGLVGAAMGALIGWIWNRRGSAGLAAGLLAGALYEAAAYSPALGHRDDLAQKAGLAAAAIVGSAAVTMALLDAWAERSPGVLASSRGP